MLALLEADSDQLAIKVGFTILVNDVAAVAVLLRHTLDFTTRLQRRRENPIYRRGEM